MKIMNDLNKQLIIGISTIVFISTLTVFGLFLSQYRSITLKKAEVDLESRATEFTEIGKLILSPSPQRPRDIYFDIMRNMMGNELTIVDLNGDVLVTTLKGDLNSKNINYLDTKDVTTTYDFSSLFGTKTLTVISPVIINGEISGFVFLHQNVASIYNSYMSLIYLIIISLLFSLVLSVILAIIYARRFVLPIEKITNVANQIKEGNYKEKVNIVRPDQLGVLATTIDQMSDEIDNNIMEIKELESRAKELVANVSHEFKTPLTIIRGYAHSLKDKTIKPNNEVYDKIINNTVELERLVNDLLDLNAYQVGNINLKMEEFLLNELLIDIVNEFSLLAKNKNITIDLKVVEKLINADYSKIRQLLIILIDNAIKYSNENSNIIVELNDNLKIVDFGVGIEKKELDKIFDRYYKVSADEVGYGIGLSLAKYITDAHNFKIDFKSKKNKGTTVTLEF